MIEGRTKGILIIKIYWLECYLISCLLKLGSQGNISLFSTYVCHTSVSSLLQLQTDVLPIFHSNLNGMVKIQHLSEMW